jgi:transposase
VRRYVRGNKTDRADAAALLEAARCAEIRCVPVKSVDQQAVQQLHRLRRQYQRTRTARVNQLRGCLREFGIFIPQGIAKGLSAMRAALQSAENELPDVLRPYVCDVLEEVRALKTQITRLERSLRELTRHDPVVQRLLEIPGIGPLGATALRASVGTITRFANGRELASWLGLTAREHSSGERRRLGGISKRGDAYLRTLLVHGARSALLAARRAAVAGRTPDRLRAWALQTEQRRGTNKATVALANKLARIVWASWAHERVFNGDWQRSRLH